MSSPTEQSWKALKRIGGNLCGLPRLVYTYRKQEVRAIDVYVDTDWAGCVETRKSSSGVMSCSATTRSSIGHRPSQVYPSAARKLNSTESPGEQDRDSDTNRC